MRLQIAISVVFSATAIWAQPDVLTGNYDLRRSNANQSESILTPAAVSGGNFGKLAGIAVDGQIYAQPLYATNVKIAGATKNVVFVATMNNSVYALDAADPAQTLWQVNLGPAVPSATVALFADINPRIGILSTPVIDSGKQLIYVVTDTYENGAPVFRLHALAIADGREMLNGPVAIAASVTAMDGTLVPFDPIWHLQRPGLALANHTLYIGFGSHGDTGPYHGWLIAYDATTLARKAVFNSTPNGNAGAIWQSGRAPAIDDAGNVYVVTGNGDFNGQTNFGGSVLKLSGTDLTLLDWYTPAEWQYLNDNDLDVGSVGALLAGGTNMMVTADKGGRVIHLDESSMGHLAPQGSPIAFKASPSIVFNVGLWSSDQGMLLYQHDWHGPLKSYQVNATDVTTTPVSTGTELADSIYQGIVISSNGGTGGIVWETVGEPRSPGTLGTLRAFDAKDLTRELWNSNNLPADVLGPFAKFAVPTIAAGRIYVPTFANQLAVYGVTSTTASSDATPHISAVMNGASFVADSVSPGEVLAIFGTNLGPADLANLQLDDSGSVVATLAGTRVLFDGVAAPLLYTSAGQVGVVVPFGLNAATTQMVVEYNSQSSTALTLPVTAATPGIFSVTGLGTEQASVVNEDGTVNSSDNAAPAGSIVAIFATGLGQTSPAGQDGKVTGAVLSDVNLPISVWIGEVPAEVIYAGSAPGTVQGVFQINVRVPAAAPIWDKNLITLQVGSAFSANAVTLAVE